MEAKCSCGQTGGIAFGSKVRVVTVPVLPRESGRLKPIGEFALAFMLCIGVIHHMDSFENNDLVARGLSDYAPYLMNRITHRYNQTLHDVMAEAGLSTIKMRVVCALAAKGPLTVNDLAVFAVAEQSTMSRTLDQMAREGLVVRAVDQSDSRMRVISLTCEGRATYDRIWPAMQAAEDAMFKGIDAATKRQLIGALNQMLRNIRLNPV